MVIVYIILILMGAMGLLLMLFLMNPKNVVLEITEDLNAKMYKRKVKHEGNKLSVGGKINKSWLINKETQHFNLSSAFGNNALYIVAPEGAQPLRFNDSCFKKDFISPKTIKTFYENTMIEKVLKTVSGLGLNEKVILMLGLGLVGVTVAYFILVAPNYMPIDACIGG